MAEDWVEIQDIKQDIKEIKEEMRQLRQLLQELKRLEEEKKECKDCAEIRSAYAKIRRGEVFPYFKKLSFPSVPKSPEK